MSTTNRRSFLRLVLLGSGSALMAACAAPAAPSPTAAPAQKAAAPTTAPAAPASGAPPAPTAAAAAASNPANLVDQLYEAAKKEGKVVWWDQHELKVAEAFMAGFKQTYPGIEFEYLEGNLDELRPKAIAETRAGRVTLDFIDTGQSYNAYKDVNMVTSNAELLVAAGVPLDNQYEGTYSPEWTVYLASYNPNMVKPEELPKTWDDFLDPKWKGKLGLEARLRPFVYGTPFLGGEEKVVEYMKKLKELTPRMVTGNTATDTLLVAGEFPIAIGTYLHNLVKFKPKGQPWEFIPLQEVFTNQPGPGYTVHAQAPHPNAGRLFLYWFVGPEGVALMDKERFKGKPLPGSGTGPSKILEDNKMSLKVSPLEIELNYKKYEAKYLEALGLPTT
jgi:iron(III) transport system substrate-binding protein